MRQRTFGEIDQTSEGDIVWQCRKPVLGRLLQPFFRPGLAAIEVAPGNAHTQARKARGAFVPSRQVIVRQAPKTEGEGFDLDRLMRCIAAQALGRPPVACCAGLGWQRARAGRPDRGVRQMPATRATQALAMRRSL